MISPPPGCSYLHGVVETPNSERAVTGFLTNTSTGEICPGSGDSGERRISIPAPGTANARGRLQFRSLEPAIQMNHPAPVRPAS